MSHLQELFHQKPEKIKDGDLLKIAFDGDSVIFSDESEKVFQEGA